MNATHDRQEMVRPPRRPGARRPPRPWALLALFVPGALFGLGLLLVRGHPRFAWLSTPAEYPWEFWAVALCGLVGTAGGPAAAGAGGRAVHDGGDLLRRVRLPPQALRPLRDGPAPAAGLRQRPGLAGVVALVLRSRGGPWLSACGPATSCGGRGRC